MSPLISKRYYLILILFSFGFFVVGIRFVYLGTHRDAFLHFIETSRQRLKVLPASRGKIIDRNGICLAGQKKIYDVGVDLTQIQESDKTFLPQLSYLLQIPIETLEKIWVKSSCRWKKLQKDVSENVYHKVNALNIKGVYGNEKLHRAYLHTPSLSYVVGCVNKDGIPFCGIEKMMQFYLSGQNGYLAYEIDGKNKELIQHRKDHVEPINGYTIELTIDHRIQQIAEQVVLDNVKKFKPQSIQVLISHPQSGEVLALVNWPFFDSNHYNKYSVDTLTNKAITNIYEPGSIFKAITVSAALDCDAVKPEDRFDCGKHKAIYNGKELPLPQDWRTFNQIMDVSEILSHSSNRGTVQIAFRLGAENLYRYAYKFGFGQSTISGFSGETNGILHPVKNWDHLTITRMPIGHSIACSIFQMHYAMGVIANGGTLFYPQFIRRIYDANGEIVRSFMPQKRRTVIKETTSKIVRNMLLLTAQSKAFIPHYYVTGKTGTSQKIINGHYSHQQHVASFSGFFPNQNPQISITITVDSPVVSGTGYGSVVAAPIFKEIAENIITYMGIPPLPKVL